MVPLELEGNIEIFSAYAVLATREVERLSEELAAARHQDTEQGVLNDSLKDQLIKIQKTFCDFGFEKTEHQPSTHHNDPQLLLHGKAEPKLNKIRTK